MGNMSQYYVSQELLRKLKIRYYGEIFNREDEEKRLRIRVTLFRKLQIEKEFKIKLELADDEQKEKN